MNLFKILSIVRARWIAAVVVLVASIVSAVVYALGLPVTYVATAAIVVDAKADPVASMLYGSMGGLAAASTQIDIMRSDRVAQRVVRNLKLTEMEDLRKQWAAATKGKGNLEAWIAETIQRGMDASLSRAGSNVVNISYRSGDPRFAAAVANAFVQAYLETSIELKVDPAKQYNTFFADQVKEARDNLEKAQVAVTRFQQEKGLIATDERVDLETSRLTTLTQELLSLQAVREEASTRRAQSLVSPDTMPDILNNGTVNTIKGDLARAEAKYQELISRYGENHPQVQETMGAIKDLKTRLVEESRKALGGVAVGAKMVETRERELAARLESQRSKVLELKDVRNEGSVLARDVESAQRTYDQVLSRFNQTSLEVQNRQTNAVVLSQALPPNEPSSKTAKTIMLGILAGIAGGVILAFLLEQMDKRIRVPSDIITNLGLPVVGILPSPRMSRRFRGLIASNQLRVIRGRVLPEPEKGAA